MLVRDKIILPCRRKRRFNMESFSIFSVIGFKAHKGQVSLGVKGAIRATSFISFDKSSHTLIFK